jgi:predicted DNA-binding mobile mystery protein A
MEKHSPATNSLALAQIERRLTSIRRVSEATQVRPGWIRYMRQALGMTLESLAHRLSLSTATIAQIEKREALGTVTLETLKKTAHALNCELIYAFVPKTDIQSILQKQAIEKAKTILANADLHMTLEDQRADQDLDERIKRLARKLLESGDLW